MCEAQRVACMASFGRPAAAYAERTLLYRLRVMSSPSLASRRSTTCDSSGVTTRRIQRLASRERPAAVSAETTSE